MFHLNPYLLAPLCMKMDKKLSASRGLHPVYPHHELCPWTSVGALIPEPRYRLELRARHGPPPGKSWIRPWFPDVMWCLQFSFTIFFSCSSPPSPLLDVIHTVCTFNIVSAIFQHFIMLHAAAVSTMQFQLIVRLWYLIHSALFHCCIRLSMTFQVFFSSTTFQISVLVR